MRAARHSSANTRAKPQLTSLKKCAPITMRPNATSAATTAAVQKTTRRRDGFSLKAAAGSPASIRPIAACAVCPLANDLNPSLITPAAI